MHAASFCSKGRVADSAGNVELEMLRQVEERVENNAESVAVWQTDDECVSTPSVSVGEELTSMRSSEKRKEKNTYCRGSDGQVQEKSPKAMKRSKVKTVCHPILQRQIAIRALRVSTDVKE